MGLGSRTLVPVHPVLLARRHRPVHLLRLSSSPRVLGRAAAGGRARGTQSARAVLAERYARGEIDEAEYRARLEVLLATGPQPPA